MEKRRIRHLEEKQNAAYALKQDIDPVGVQLFNMIKKQLPDGLRWNGKDIEIHGVKITPDYAEKNCVLARGRNFDRNKLNILEISFSSVKYYLLVFHTIGKLRF